MLSSLAGLLSSLSVTEGSRGYPSACFSIQKLSTWPSGAKGRHELSNGNVLSASWGLLRNLSVTLLSSSGRVRMNLRGARVEFGVKGACAR